MCTYAQLSSSYFVASEEPQWCRTSLAPGSTSSGDCLHPTQWQEDGNTESRTLFMVETFELDARGVLKPMWQNSEMYDEDSILDRIWTVDISWYMTGGVTSRSMKRTKKLGSTYGLAEDEVMNGHCVFGCAVYSICRTKPTAGSVRRMRWTLIKAWRNSGGAAAIAELWDETNDGYERRFLRRGWGGLPSSSSSSKACTAQSSCLWTQRQADLPVCRWAGRCGMAV